MFHLYFSFSIEMSTVHDLKVDITSLDFPEERANSCLVCLNFNIPKRTHDNHQELYQILGDISNFLTRHFLPDNRVSYQVTASYYLRNRLTGDERLWTGSFFPGNRSSLSGQFFQNFHQQTFAQKVNDYTTPANVQQFFVWNHLPTEWTFSHVASFIVNCQVNISNNHVFLRNFNLQEPGARGGRRRDRRHVILAHPW